VSTRSARRGAAGSGGSGVVIRRSQAATSAWKLAGKAESGSMKGSGFVGEASVTCGQSGACRRHMFQIAMVCLMIEPGLRESHSASSAARSPTSVSGPTSSGRRPLTVQ
jgi:hypothetical protein